MIDNRLNHYPLIFVYKEELDEINIKFIKNGFIKVKESRISIFGLYQFWAFVCFSLFFVTVYPVSSLYALSIPSKFIGNF